MGGARQYMRRLICLAVALTLGAVVTTFASPSAGASGATWTNPKPLNPPFARFGASMAYDPVTKTTVLFGGAKSQNQGDNFNDTWEWNGSAWKVDHPIGAPAPSFRAALTYDPFNHGLLLFNGETWEWNGSNWTQLTPTHEPPFAACQYPLLATDTHNNTVLLFTSPCDGVSGLETWEWNGSDWVQQSPPVEPPQATSMAFDPAHNAMLLYADGLWEWDGSYWLQVSPVHNIPGGAYFMSTGPAGTGLVAFTPNSSDTFDSYEWTGTDWSQLATTLEPPYASNPSFADGPTGIVLFGLYPSDSTWVFGSATTVSACASSTHRCITSANHATATVGSPFSFTVTTSGTPTPKIKKTGKLPKGIHFHNNHNGTATLSGTPKSTKHRSAVGTYHLTFTAKFGKGKAKQFVTQAFTLTVTP